MRITLGVTLAVALLASVVSTSAWSQSVEMARATIDLKGLSVAPDAVAEDQPASIPATPDAPEAPTVASNYAFATATNGSLTDMSTATTQLVAANIDDAPASAITNIGFDFIFQGSTYSQFSVNANGALRFGPAAVPGGTPYQPLAVAGQAKLTAYGADQSTSATGRVHFRIDGTAPNRVLVIEWLNMFSHWNTPRTPDLTYQVRLFETTGVIEYVYGAMTLSAAGAADANSNDPQFGFSSSNIAGSVGSVTAAQSGTPDPTFDGASATPVNNLYTAGVITVLNSAADGARRVFTFTPPAAIAPTALTFNAVTAISMDLSWTDSPNELSYLIYRSTDGTTFSLVGTAAQDATTFAATGLAPSTTYSWRVVALSEGTASPPLSGTQGTNPPGNIVSTGAGGNWSDPATWVGGNVPGSSDNATITNGATVTIDTAAVALSLTIGTGGTPAILQWDSAAARSLDVSGSTLIASNGTFATQATGTVTTHVLSLAGDLTNNGVLDFSTSANTAGAGISFTGAANATFSGSGTTTDVRSLTIAKGTVGTVVDLNPLTLTVQGVNTDSAGFVTLTGGTLHVSGTFPMTNRTFAIPAFSIPAAAGFWLDNPNYVITGQNASGTVAGRLRVSQGTFNIGTAAGNSLGFSAGSNITVEGGAINSTGRFGVATSANAITYTQTGGTVTVATVGNVSTTLASFDMGTGAASSISISGGQIVVQTANTAASGPRDYRHQSGPAGTTTVTAGVLQLGNAASPATVQTFDIAGVVANLVVSGTTAAHVATFLAPSGFNNVTRDITIDAGATLNIGNQLFLMNGVALVNNGTLTASGVSSRFIFFRQATANTYAGTGNVTVPMTSLELQNDIGLTVDPASSNITVGRVILFSGNITNSNKITLGIGGASTGIIQIGNTTTPTAGGTFDVPFTFDLGTGGQTISYLRTNSSKTVGPEVNPARALTNLTIDDDNPANTLTVAGGDLLVNGTLALVNGRVITGLNTLGLAAAGIVNRTAGYVDGSFRKAYAAAGSKAFEVGTANGYSPVVANATAGTFPTDVTVSAIQTVAPTIFPPADAITRHWVVGAPGVTTADLTFTYLDPADIATVTEADLLVYRRDGSSFTDLAGTVDTTANTGAVTGVSTFGVFTLAEPDVTGVDQGDLQITKTNGTTSVTAGGSTTYTIVASNPSGPQGIAGATVADSFPASLTCTWTCVGSAGGTCTAAGSGNINDVVNLPVGASVTYTAACAISAAATGSLVNTATVSVPSGAFDPDLPNNTATDTDTIEVPEADLSISKTDGVTSVAPAQSTTYTIVASNAGPIDATGATVTDTFPAALTGCSWTCVGSGGGTCAAAGSGNINELVNLPSGGSATFSATCTVSPGATGSIANTATIAAPAGVVDPVPGNNSATDTNTVQQAADVELLILNDIAFVQTNENVTLTVVVQNPGPSAAPSVAVNGVVPPELGFFSWSCVGLSGGVCGAPAGIGTFDTSANLPTGGTVIYTVQASVLGEDAAGSVSFSATATVGGSVLDPNVGNNTDTWSAEVVLFRNGFDCTLGRACGAPASPPDYETGFEAPDFTVGDVTGQQSWFAQFANWLVSTANPAEGAQHVQGLSDGLGSSFSLSPTLPAGTETHSYASARIEINNTGTGATWQFAPQDTGAALVITRVQFVRGTNQIQVLQGNPSAFVTIPAVTWPSASPFDIKVVTRRADGEMQVCLNGTSIFTGQAISTTANARDTRNVAIISLMEAGSTGSTIDYDSVIIDNTDTGGCAGPAAPRSTLVGGLPGSAEAHSAAASMTRE